MNDETSSTENNLDAIWAEITSGSRLTNRKRDAQGAFTEIAAEFLKHRDLVEALQWLPKGTVVDFCDLDDFLEEMRGRPSRWLPIRECKHRPGYARCLQCRHAEDE